MPKLTIRFINEPGLVSRLITWAEGGSLMCHVEGLSRDGKGWIGAHAGTGVQLRPLDWCQPTWERRYAIEVPDEQFATAQGFLQSRVGCPYDYGDILGMTLRDHHLHSEQRTICSALMIDFLQRACLAPLNVLPRFTYLITPETLHLSPIFIGKQIYALG